jgi:hypothetical protein
MTGPPHDSLSNPVCCLFGKYADAGLGLIRVIAKDLQLAVVVVMKMLMSI